MIISIANQKGGVGKTITTFMLTNIIADIGQPALCIDFDQTNLTDYFRIESEITIFDALSKNIPLQQVEVRIKDNLALIPSDIRTAGLDRVLSSKIRPDNLLYKALYKDQYKEPYKYIFIDCPPALDLRLINALTASDYCFIAVSTEPHSLKAVPYMLDAIQAIKENTNPNLDYRIIATRHDKVTNITRDTLETLQKTYGDVVFKTTIHQDVKMKEQAIQGKIQPSRAYEEYKELAKEVLAL